MSPVRRLLFSILALLGVLVVSIVGYVVIEADNPQAPSVLDAAYMTILTVSTVGYREAWNLSPIGQVWTMGVIVFGVGTVSVAFTSLITLFISGELRSIRERRKMDTIISMMSGHVILCGYGRMGAMAAKELEERGMQVVVVERDLTMESVLQRKGIPYIMGDATEEDVLHHAGLEGAGSLVASLPHDTDNVFITLSVRSMRPKMTIVARAEHPATEAKLLRAGASRVICAQAMGAIRIANVITRPNVVDFVEVANIGVGLEMDEYDVRPDSRINGMLLRDAGVRETTGASVVAIRREDGETLFNPEADTEIKTGDAIILVGPAGVSGRMEQL